MWSLAWEIGQWVARGVLIVLVVWIVAGGFFLAAARLLGWRQWQDDEYRRDVARRRMGPRDGA